MLKRYSYQLYPTLGQTEQLNRTFGSARYVYNNYVENNLKQNKLISYNEASRNLTLLKQDPELAWLNQVSAVALQQTLKDAAQGVKNFFKNPKKVRPPRFKKRSNRESFRIVGVKDFGVRKLNRKWGAVKLPKMGWVKYRSERDLPSTPTSVTVIKTPAGKYEVSFVVETTPVPLPPVTQSIGG